MEPDEVVFVQQDPPPFADAVQQVAAMIRTKLPEGLGFVLAFSELEGVDGCPPRISFAYSGNLRKGIVAAKFRSLGDRLEAHQFKNPAPADVAPPREATHACCWHPICTLTPEREAWVRQSQVFHACCVPGCKDARLAPDVLPEARHARAVPIVTLLLEKPRVVPHVEPGDVVEVRCGHCGVVRRGPPSRHAHLGSCPRAQGGGP